MILFTKKLQKIQTIYNYKNQISTCLGVGPEGEQTANGHKETFGADEDIRYLDPRGCFMGVAHQLSKLINEF